MKNKTIKINIFLILSLAILALAGGVLGELLTRIYLFNDPYIGAFSSDINLNDYNRSNLVIRDAKKVIVSQDVQVAETANQIRESLLKVYVKANTATQTEFDDNELLPRQAFYQLDQALATALIISSDGWALIDKNNLPTAKALTDNYVVIDWERKVYEIDQQINIENRPLILIHISNANNLRPINIMDSRDLSSGQSLLALNDNKQVLINSLGLKKEEALVESSDDFFSNLEIFPDLNEGLDNPWLFNLKGEAVALNEDSAWVPLAAYEYIWQNALLNPDLEQVALPSLGVNYINLSQVAIKGQSNQQGALIYPKQEELAIIEDSAADKAGLKAGDIILAVNSLELNSNLSLKEAILNYKAGEKVDLTISRNNTLQIINLEL